jgi:16S rRNA (guanine527-N7)-methyltransferase
MEKLIAGARKLGLELSPTQIEQFQVYYQELVDWNKRVNLTAITDLEGVQINHFLDALTVTLAWQPPIGNTKSRFIDVGTGAGMPGIPLKIVFPDTGLVLLEATAKKAAFLYHIKDTLGLDSVEIVTGRAEEVAHVSQYREMFDVVLSRAVAPLPTLAELTLPFCDIGGTLIAYKKGDIYQETDRATRAITMLGGRLRQVKKIELEEFPDRRCLLIVDKTSPTPQQYPRRPGIPTKRPLA